MSFLKWLERHGGKVHPKLDLFHTLGNGDDRGVVATSDVAEGELLLLLPISCTIFIPNDQEYVKNPDTFPPAVSYLRQSHPGLSPFLATTLALMSEVARGSDSPWAPYVATLPPSCPDCLLYWSAEEKKELEGTALEEAGPDPAADVYRRHVAPILAARTDLWPGFAPEGPGVAAAGGGREEEGEQPAGLRAFMRAAGLVQSRAFHLEAENWVSGAKKVAKLDGGATQVFLLPGIDMINHSHNPARRNAHLERLNVAQAAAAGCLAGSAAADGQQQQQQDVGAGEAAPAPADAYFVMRADKPIKAGQEVLHTYGNLSDAQLLQTYGFLDSEDDFRQVAGAGDDATAAGASAAAGGSGDPGSASKKRVKAEKAGSGGGARAGEGGGGGFRNPYNAALVPWAAVEEVCTGLLRSMDQAPSGALQRVKRDFLAAVGVLQAAAPDSTQFVLLAQEPLPDEMTTAVQVLLMTKDEFQELKREYGSSGGGSSGKAAAGSGTKGPAKSAKGAAKGSSKAGSGYDKDKDNKDKDVGDGVVGQGEEDGAVPKLSLGTALLEEDEDFAEMVCIATLQILEACMERYPTSIKDDVRLLRSDECTGRKRLAVRVRLGEKNVLQLAKKAVVELMRKLRDGTTGQDDGGEDEEGGKGADERRRAKKRRRGLGAPASKGDEEELGSSGNDEDDSEGDEDEDGEGDGLLMGSDDSEKVGYAAVDYDDGIGEAHDRGKAHEAPKDD